MLKLAAQSPYRLSLKACVAGFAASEGDIDASYKLLLECLLLSPSFLPAQETIAVNRLIARDLDTAKREFERTLRIDPDSKIGLFGRAVSMILLGKQQDVLDTLLEFSQDEDFGEASSQTLEKFFAITKHSPIAKNSLFHQICASIKESKSRTAFDLLGEVSKSGHSARLKLVLADYLIGRGERKTARSILERVQDVHPNYSALLYKLGAMLVAEGEVQKGREHLQTLLDTEPVYGDPENLLCGMTSSFADPGDASDLIALKIWCKDVVKEAMGLKKEPEPQNVLFVELMPEETVIIQEQTPQPQAADNKTKIIEADDEEQSEEYRQHQLERTRRILEEAKKILEETIAHPKPPEPQIFEVVEVVQEIVQQPATSEEEQLPHRIVTAEFEEIPQEVFQEPIVVDGGPKRIVLPTSDLEPEATEQRAWQLLTDGEAEEAFMMFSKLLRKEAEIGSDR